MPEESAALHTPLLLVIVSATPMTVTAPFTPRAASAVFVEISMTVRFITAMWREKWEAHRQIISAGLLGACRADG